MNKKKKLKIMAIVSVGSAVITAIVLCIINNFKPISDFSMLWKNLTISRWWDILFLPIYVNIILGLILFRDPAYLKISDKKYMAGLWFGLGFGLLSGILQSSVEIIGLGLLIILAWGLWFGLLRVSEMGLWSGIKLGLIWGLGFGLGLGLWFGFMFGFMVGLGLGLWFGFVCGIWWCFWFGFMYGFIWLKKKIFSRRIKKEIIK